MLILVAQGGQSFSTALSCICSLAAAVKPQDYRLISKTDMLCRGLQRNRAIEFKAVF